MKRRKNGPYQPNQSTNQSINNQPNQSINQSTIDLINRSINNQSINQSINRCDIPDVFHGCWWYSWSRRSPTSATAPWRIPHWIGIPVGLRFRGPFHRARAELALHPDQQSPPLVLPEPFRKTAIQQRPWTKSLWRNPRRSYVFIISWILRFSSCNAKIMVEKTINDNRISCRRGGRRTNLCHFSSVDFLVVQRPKSSEGMSK